MTQSPSRVAAPVVLVGERFDGFLRAGLGVTAAGFARAVSHGEYDDLPEPVQVILGQGLDEEAVTTATDAIAARGLGGRLLPDPGDLPVPVATGAVHKHDARNVLLADFRFDGAQTFEASLRLHNDNELILDHQSGAHLQGIVLIEAARQLLLAVCELEYLRSWPDQRFAFLLSQVDVRFDRPVFPLPLRIRATARRAEAENVNRMWFELEAVFTQGDREAAVTTAATAVRPWERFQPTELRTAQTAIAELAGSAKVRAA